MNSAILKLRVSTPDSKPINVYRITDGWKENKVNWRNTGRDFDSTAIHGSFTPSSDDAFAFVDVTSLVQEWACGTPNHGLMLIASSKDEESKYHSKEEDKSRFRPSMEVTFIPARGSCP